MSWDQLIAWLDEHSALLFWLATGSLVMFVGSLIAIPMLVVRIPTDYFAHKRRPRPLFPNRHPLERALLVTVKNLLAIVFLLAGFAMLFVPGQGLLTMFIGFLLLDGPGKYRAERWLVARGPVRKPINWLRKRRGRPALQLRVPGDTAPG